MGYALEYATVLVPDRARVLGIPLRAPTLGHLLLLWRVKSPFVQGGRIRTSDILTAAYILSRPWMKAARGLGGRIMKWRLWLWGRQMSWLSSLLDDHAAAEQIEHLISAAHDGPTMWEAELRAEPGKRTTCSASLLQVTKVRLMVHLGLSREQALDTPLQEALWDLACWAEDAGHAEWVTEEEEAAIEAALKN